MALMEASIPALRRYATSLLRDHQEVDDLVHDCLVRAIDRLDTRRSDGNVRAWLFAIMHNLYVSRFHRKRRREDPGIDGLTESIVAVHATQEGHVQVRDVMLAVQRLPEEYRSVLLLVAVEDLSYADVAQVLNIPIGTVMSRLARARESVRKHCEEK